MAPLSELIVRAAATRVAATGTTPAQNGSPIESTVSTQLQGTTIDGTHADVDTVEHRGAHHLKDNLKPESVNADVVAPKTKEAAPSDIPPWLRGVKQVRGGDGSHY